MNGAGKRAILRYVDVGVRFGATHVRVGTAIFGERAGGHPASAE